MYRIKLQNDGRRVVIPLRILRPEVTDFTSVEVLALLDTGATTSGIARDVANQLDLVGRGKRPMGSAHGLAQTERFLFRIGLDLDHDDAQPTLPYVFPAILGFEIVRGSSFDALLGMDVLRLCDLELKRDGSGSLKFG